LFLTKTLYKGASPPGREAPYIHDFLLKKNIYFLIKIQEKYPKNKSPKKEYLFSNRIQDFLLNTKILFLIKIQEKYPKNKYPKKEYLFF